MEKELTENGLKEGSLIWVAVLLITYGMSQLQAGFSEVGAVAVLIGTALIAVREYYKPN